ncbi:hypothetical protein QJS10_CPB11g01868 [Acorus calamus]|uniref:Uncharacterized protein n=1 Tax=Acorus calamus TaxID=4465 RepID=A0AAV9DV36_ACOCL|nr:hypothetical protein QJS10_CPB11g01868 [Acorus calamus]
MVTYHAWLFYRIVTRPTTTVVGLNAINRIVWVRTMMEDSLKNGVLSVQTLRNNIMASTLLASTAIMLSSVIAVLMTGTVGGRDGALKDDVYGNTSERWSSIKYFSILSCFLLAFLLNVQSIRYYSHASILINVPVGKAASKSRYLSEEYVAGTVNRGSYFWSLGLRSFYFSCPLFLWMFGPIPMFMCCFVLVFALYFLDVTFDFGDEWGSRGGEVVGEV